MEGHKKHITTSIIDTTMMQSIALDQSSFYPNDDDEYVVVDFRAAEPSQLDPLEGISDDEDEFEYDYCDDIDRDSSVLYGSIHQSMSFEEVSDRLGTASGFYFGDKAHQLLLDLDNSTSMLHELSERGDIPSCEGPIIASYPSWYENTSSEAAYTPQDESAVSSASGNALDAEITDCESYVANEVSHEPAESNNAPVKSAIVEVKQPKIERNSAVPEQRSSSNGRDVSRMTNKKRRKQLKLAKKAAAAAAAAASLARVSTFNRHSHHIMGDQSESHPSNRQKVNVTAMPTSPKNKNQTSPSSIAVACATQSLAEYRLELQSQHVTSTIAAATTNKLVR